MRYCIYCEDDFDNLIDIGGPYAHPRCVWYRVDSGLMRAATARELVGPRPATRK